MSDREKLIIDGNAFYELDMDCVNRNRRQRGCSVVDKKTKNNPGPRKQKTK